MWVSPLFSVSSLLSLAKVPNYWTGKIAADERVVFFPTAAHKMNATHWQVPIHGWIFEPELESKKRRAFVQALGRFFKVNSGEEKAILKDRIMPFTVDNQSMKYVKIKIGDMLHTMPRSSKDGHFHANLTIEDSKLNNKEGVVTFEAVDRCRTFPGVVHLVPPTGISIISDIDDTVKFTNYLDKKEFYKNTFIREFQAVPGMQQLYQNCKSQYENCHFHYVSAAPYQLYEELNKFFKRDNFPHATFHLKQIRVKDKTLLQLLADPLDYKLGQIEPILKRFPNRKFILVGDSGEKDPEVYCELFQKYPSQIEKIWIRNVNESPSARMNRVDPDRWQYFNDGTDL
jgi:hypothetical protein